MKKPIKKLLFAPLFTILAMLAATACTENEQTNTNLKSSNPTNQASDDNSDKSASVQSTNNKNSERSTDKSQISDGNQKAESSSTSGSEVKKEENHKTTREMNQIHSSATSQMLKPVTEGDNKNKVTEEDSTRGDAVTHDGSPEAKGEKSSVASTESLQHITNGCVSSIEAQSPTKVPPAKKTEPITPQKEGGTISPKPGAVENNNHEVGHHSEPNMQKP